MRLRFFADHCISNLVIQMLRDAGHEVLRLRDYIPKDSADSVVILKAQELDSILISLNGDFSDIVTYPPANEPTYGPSSSIPISPTPVPPPTPRMITVYGPGGSDTIIDESRLQSVVATVHE